MKYKSLIYLSQKKKYTTCNNNQINHKKINFDIDFNKININQYITERGYTDLKALVAFSGELDIDGTTWTEAVANGFAETELPKKFDTPEYQMLVVAEKYQTGFDQPKLVAMYVDKKLAGLQAVQTLARLNRTCLAN